MPKHIPGKYPKAPTVDLPDRTWPSKVIERAPIWCSVDLRDGNQALPNPMDVAQKLKFFEMLVKIGFKQIEVGFPSASEPDFEFVRLLIEQNKIPDDVTISVLTPSRGELIQRTFEALAGVKQAIVHQYLATSPKMRTDVLNLSKEDTVGVAVAHAEMICDLMKKRPDTRWQYQFSAEHCTDTEIDLAAHIFDSVAEAYGATPDNKIIVNMPATVEGRMANSYADYIELIQRKMSCRDSMIVSLHPHNDRGTAVAAAELGILAGADRVEGCLFSGGERAGNLDLVTLAMNLYIHGVDPELNFSDINYVRDVVTETTKMPVHPRHPFAGELVFTAFSGSHQDGIKKTLDKQQEGKPWEVVYLPVDPADVGREYEPLIRVNSQSGKAGAAYVLRECYGIEMPAPMQREFSGVVQKYTDQHGGEVSGQKLMDLFTGHYLNNKGPFQYVSYELCQRKSGEPQRVNLTVAVDGKQVVLEGEGTGPVDAVVHAFNLPIGIHDYVERSLSAGSDAKAISLMEMMVKGESGYYYGVGISDDTNTANIEAVVRGASRIIEDGKIPKPQWLVASNG